MKFFFDAWTLVAFSGSLGVQITVVFSSLDAGFNSWLFSLLGCLRSILIDDQVLGRVNFCSWARRFWQAGSWMYGFSALWMQVSMACSSIGFHGYISLDANFMVGSSTSRTCKNLAARLRIYCESIMMREISRASTSDLQKRGFLMN
ncbi:uncharacterized protein OCT59_013926 [Rhizophagus irregularis]|uniref:Uncharacterized protein n=1 Tax=Rhizophagus irregularis TaxID=588596 RepID=A0A916E4P3_9GLOM|nr:hypothetical protein OCT59_013926 [Rhizophagus irregularis]CAB4467770.1 unnamed protein product [Rhizophagus irregularis]CAB5360410.1 unnamed protein product [Rhizophagus irregularis]